jgi:hypothetical protein
MDQLFTRQRRFYPYIFGGILWSAWLLSISLGTGSFDLGGQVIGTDYLMFYTAGSTIASGNQAELYDFEAQQERQKEIVGPSLEGIFAFITLPFLAWLFVPFSAVPYVWSFFLWSVTGLLLTWAALRLLGNGAAFPLALTFLPVFSNISFGQNASVSLVILASVYALWKREKLWLAGLVLALLLYKPQLILGIGFFWVLNWRRDWPAISGFTLGALLLAGLMFGVMPEATAAYITFARETLPNLASLGQFPVWHMHHFRGFLQLLLPSTVADLFWIGSSLTGAWVFWRVWKREEGSAGQRPFWFANAILLTLWVTWVTPHAMIYDWSLLLIPAVLLWQVRPAWRSMLRRLFVWGWLAYLVSGPLTAGQLAVFPVAIQISVIFYAWALWSLSGMSENGWRAPLRRPELPKAIQP